MRPLGRHGTCRGTVSGEMSVVLAPLHSMRQYVGSFTLRGSEEQNPGHAPGPAAGKAGAGGGVPGFKKRVLNRTTTACYSVREHLVHQPARFTF